jgi:hypothetical protein
MMVVVVGDNSPSLWDAKFSDKCTNVTQVSQLVLLLLDETGVRNGCRAE